MVMIYNLNYQICLKFQWKVICDQGQKEDVPFSFYIIYSLVKGFLPVVPTGMLASL